MVAERMLGEQPPELSAEQRNLQPAAYENAEEAMDVPATAQRTVEVPQVRYNGEINDVSAVREGQVPTIRTVQSTVEGPHFQLPDRVADVPVVSRRHVLQVIRVIDSEDLPLNIAGETLLRNKILRVIKKEYVTKCLDKLAEMAELLDDYKKLYEQWGKCRNYEDSHRRSQDC